MGQKVNPIGLRIGINKDWSSQWYATKKEFSKFLKEDYTIRSLLKTKYKNCNISKIIIERNDKRLAINIFVFRPGVIIGSKGSGIDTIKKEISKLTNCENIYINIKEIKKADTDAVLIAENIAAQLEKRVSWKRAIKQAIQRCMKGGVQGVKVTIAGRLNGQDMARTVTYKEGSLPLQTLRGDIDYGTAEAKTTFGIIGLKAWVYRGEVLGKRNAVKNEEGGKN